MKTFSPKPLGRTPLFTSVPAAPGVLTGPAISAASRKRFRFPAYVLALVTGATLLAAHCANATTYTDSTNGTANFSTAFSPSIPSSGTTTADTLVFSNTATSSQTDDLNSSSQPLNANVLTLSNTAALTLLQGASTTIGLGGTNATVNLNNTAAVTDNLIFALSSNLTFQGTGNATITGGSYSGVTGGGITGTGDALIMNGTGTLTLDVQNSGGTGFTYTGGTYVNSGTLQYGSSKANYSSNMLGSGTVYLGNTSGSANATLQQIYNSQTLSNNIVVQSGNTGTISILANGNTTLGGTITLGTASSTGKGVTLGGSVLAMAISSVIQDPTGLMGTGGTVTIANTNTVFDATNTYTGTTVINSGDKLTLGGNVGTGAATSAGSLSPSSAITDNGTLAFNRTAAVTQGTDFASVIGGSGGVLQTSATSTLTLNGANTYGGGTQINQGTITVGTGGTLGATTGILTVNNTNTGAGTAVVLNLATAAPTTTGSLSGAISTPSSGTNTDTINNGGQLFTVNQTTAGTFAGVIAGTGAFTLGSLSTNTLTLTGTDTYSGGTTISAGTLRLGNATALGASTGAVSVTSGAVLDLNGTTMTNTNALTLNGTGISSGGALINSSATSATYAGPITLGTGSGSGSSGNPYTVSIVANNGALITTGAISTTSTGGDDMLTLGGTGTAGNDVQSTLTDAGGYGLVISKIGAGTWTIGGNGTSPSERGNISDTAGTLNFGVAGTEAPSFTYSQFGASNPVGASLLISGSAAFNMVNGTLTLGATNGSSLPGIDNTGTGNFSISGGTMSVTDTTGLGLNNTSSGNINISGGSLTVTSTGTAGFEDNGSGNVNISGGSLTVNGNGIGLYDLSTGAINVSGATTSVTLTASQGLILNGTETYTQTGGTVTTNGYIELANGGGTSTVNVSGGSLTTTAANHPWETVRGTSTTTVSGTGTITTPLLDMTTTQLSTGGVISTFNLGNGTVGAGTLATGQIIDGTNGGGAGTQTFNFNGGTLKATAGSTAFMTGLTNAFVLSGGANINVQTFSDTIGQNLLTSTTSTGGGLTLTGTTGTLVLAGTNTYTGPTLISGGTLQLGNGGTTGSISTSSVITDNGTLAFNLAYGTNVTQGTNFNGAGITGTGGLTQAGAGTVVLNAANSYAGVTSVTNGTLNFAKEVSLYNDNTSLWTAANISVVGTAAPTYAIIDFNVGGTGEFTSSDINTLLTNIDTANSTAGGLKNNSFIGFDTTNSGGTFTITSSINNTGASGANTVGLLKYGPNTLVLSGVNTYTGSTTIYNGALTIAGSGSLGSGNYAAAIADYGTLNYNSSATQTLSGGIQGTGALTKGGSGTLTLGGSNAYSGATTDSFGTLQLTGTLTGTTGVTVNGNATFIDGSSTAASNNSVTDRINNTAPLTLGGTGGAGTFTEAFGATGTTSQTLASLAIGLGGNNINTTNTAAGTLNLIFTGTSGAGYTRSTGGLVNVVSATGFAPSFTNAPTAAGGSSVAGSSAPILIGATLNGNDFIAAAAGTLAAPTYTTNGATALTADANINVTGGNTTLANNTTLSVNSLRFPDATARTLALGTGSVLTVASGGILTPALQTTANISHIISGGTLTSGTGDLWVYSASGSAGGSSSNGNERIAYNSLAINSVIADNAATSTPIALTIGGGEQIVLGGTNTYSGGTFLDSGLIVIGADANLGAAGGTVTAVSGGNVINPSTSFTFNSSRNFVVNAGASLTIGDIGNLTTTIPGTLSGGGILAAGYVSNGQRVVLTGNNSSFTGTYNVSGYLQANEGVGLSANANLSLIGRNNGGPSYADFGVLETNGTFSRSVGTGADQVQWNGGAGYSDGGFAAVGGSLTVNLGGAGATLTPGVGGFLPVSDVLTLQDVASTGQLTFANAINNNGTTLNVQQGMSSATAATNATMTGVISGSGGFAKEVNPLSTIPSVYGGLGLLTLSGANTYTGATSIQGGTLSVSSLNYVTSGSLSTHATSSNLGIPSSTANGTIAIGSAAFTGTLQYTGTGETTDRVINLAGTTGGATLDNEGTGTLQFTSALTATGAGAKTLTLTGSTAGAGTLSAAIVDSSSPTSVAKTGTGTWTLSGNNSYSGTTMVGTNGGALVLNGTPTAAATGNVSVNSGGTLLGNGTAPSGTLTVNSGGNLSPGGTVANGGTTATSFGVLHVGALTLSSGSNFNLLLGDNTASGSPTTGGGAGTYYSQLAASSASITGSNLNVTANSVAVGDEFLILLNSGSLTGTFSGLAQGSSFMQSGDTFSISYQATDAGATTGGNDIEITVTAVPEPATWLAGLTCFGILGYGFRRRALRGC